MNESGAAGSNSSASVKSETGKDLLKVGVNSSINGGGGSTVIGKAASDDGTDVGPDMMVSPTGAIVNNGGSHQHHHHHHHHSHNHQHHQQLQQQQQQHQQQQSVDINNGSGVFYDQKSDISSTAQMEEDDGLGPLPPKWEKAYTDSGEVYFIE